MSFYGQSTAYANIPSSSNEMFHAQNYADNAALYNVQKQLNGVPAPTLGSALSRGQPAHGYPAVQHHDSQQQKHVPLHMRPNAMDYKKYVSPPQHPAQRERSRSRSPNRGLAQLPSSVIQVPPQLPPNTYIHASAPISYGTSYQRPYQSPYAGSSVGSGVQPVHAHSSQVQGQQPSMPPMERNQALRQYIPPTALFLQSIYSPQTQHQQSQPQSHFQSHHHSQSQPRPVSMHIQSLPTPVTPNQQQTRPRSSTLQSQPAVSPQHTLNHPSKFPTSIAGVDITASPPKPTTQPVPAPGPGPVSNPNPTVGSRRPLPQPGTTNGSRPRPMTMPPQAFAQAQSAFSSFQHSPQKPSHHAGGSSISSLQSIIDRPRNLQRPNVRTQTDKPSSSFSAALPMRKAASQSPERKALPTPKSSVTGLPSSPPSTSAFGAPRSSRIDFGLPGINSSPIVLSDVLPPVQDHLTCSHPPSQQSPTQSQRRALPQAPSGGSSATQPVQSKGPRPLERKCTVSVTQIVSKLNGSEKEHASAPIDSSKVSIAFPPSPSKSSSSPILPAELPPDIPKMSVAQPHACFGSDSNDEDDEYVSALETGDSSHSDQKSPQFGIRDLPTRKDRLENKDQPSPQYGIRDLPTREARERGRETERKLPWGALRKVQPKALKRDPPESEDTNTMKSPQYGIRDLPLRTKTVLERRKIWERAEPEAAERQTSMRRPVTSTSVGPRAQSSSPTKSSHRSIPSVSSPPAQPTDAEHRPLAALSPPRKAPVIPIKSPQPQVPQQTRKYPMPAVQHPKPSRTERTPSWTLPSADLEKLASNTKDEPKISLAMKIATMTLVEDDTALHENAGLKDLEERKKATSVFTSARPSTSTSSKPRRADVFSKSQSATRSLPSTVVSNRRNIDLNLDDSPPAPHRPLSRTRSRSPISSPAVPVIKSLLEDPPIPQVSVQVPLINVPDEEPSSVIPPIPVINIPGDDDDSEIPVISISGTEPRASRNSTASVPAILEDLVKDQSPPKRGLPRPPAISTPSNTSDSTVSSATPGTRSNIHSRGGGLACGGCGESIIGRIVSAMGLRWHPQCFRCCVCSEHLEHVSSYEHKGKPYCHLDYHEIFAPQCYHCKTPIVDERFITLDDPALGKRTYHEQHFFCAECGDPFLTPSQSSALSKSNVAHDDSKRQGPNINIKGDGAFDIALDVDGEEVGFTVFRGHPYCEACHVRLRAPKCKKCKRSIRDGDKAVEALGGKWCFDCFVCAGCEKPFEEPSFFQREKKPFCEHCFSVILRNEI